MDALDCESTFIMECRTIQSDDGGLKSIIAETIARQGPISTAQFMELALYHPLHGYYETEDRIGKSGDFVTGVSVGDLFGALLCEQLRQWTKEQGDKCPLWVEAGAHDGRLACDILNHCQRCHPQTYERVGYRIVEPSKTRRRRQKRQLERHSSKVRWMKSWEEHRQNSISGVIFSNELLDAFPVERVCWDAANRIWRRWGVSAKGGDLHWCILPEPFSQTATDFGWKLSEEIFEHLPDGFTVEVGAAASHWWGQAASRLAVGYLFTIDYGLTGQEFFAPRRRQGTLRAYSRHQQIGNLLENPGQQDLTSHVNYTALLKAGQDKGLETVGIQPQETFLMSILRWLSTDGRLADILTPSRIRQLQSLVHPEHFGRSFSALIQRRPRNAPLAK